MSRQPCIRSERQSWQAPQVRSQRCGNSPSALQAPDPELVRTASECIGYLFRDPDLLHCAITHKSFANEAPPDDNVDHNERLEFLGDAVLNLIVSEMLMNVNPGASEGQLSRMRAYLVCERELARTSTRMGLGKLLRLGKGEERSGGRTKSSLLANLFEAILGAVFVEGGLPSARRVVERTLGKQVQASPESVPFFDPKSRLQELLQREGKAPPSYRLVALTGPEHQRRFTVAVFDGEGKHLELGRGEGGSKKEAEQSAARDVLRHVGQHPDDGHHP
jgi:ribonuclease-3